MRKEAFMRIVIGLVAVIVVLAASTAPGSAQNRRWCTERGVGSWGFPNCAYDTYEQCAATASGLGLHCTQNYYYKPQPKPEPRKARRKKRGSGE
jgi:hypothetical protein